jgi:hypothetical protein
MSGSEQALEVAIVDVEKAAEVIGLATAPAFWKWRDAGKMHAGQIDFVPRALTILVPAKQVPAIKAAFIAAHYFATTIDAPASELLN